MIKEIQGVIYDGEDPGQAFGGGIYSVSCNIGFANTPTKITLNIVSKDSEYTITDDDLVVSSGGDHKITIGGVRPWTAPGAPPADPVGGVTFNRMYIYSYSFNNTPGSKTLTVNFVDHSMCLDKIFVGLIGRHGTKTALAAGVDDIYNPADEVQVKSVSLSFGFRLLCLRCNELRPTKDITPAPWEPPRTVTRQAYIAGDGNPCGGTGPINTYCRVDQDIECINGGYILLGSEQFKETECEIPKVEYTFDDLCNALDFILGADPQGCNGPVSYRHNLRDFKRSSTYQASYTGTLREVLSAWAADFSFDFTFDYSTEFLWIQGVDLKEPIDLTEVKNAIQSGFGPDSDRGLIRNHRELHTLENTYYQTPLVKYIKPPRPFQRAKTHYQDNMRGRVLTPLETVGTTAHLGRTDDELYVSMALATYQDEARIIWLSDLARSKHEETNWVNPLHGPPGGGAAGEVDPAYDPTVHGDCSKSEAGPNNGPAIITPLPEFSTEADCQAADATNTWTPNPNDRRLRRDTPWPALGFFPSISFNKALDPTKKVDNTTAATNWNPRFFTKETGTLGLHSDRENIPPMAWNPNQLPQLDCGWAGPNEQVVGGKKYPKRKMGRCCPTLFLDERTDLPDADRLTAACLCHKDNTLAYNHYFWREKVVADFMKDSSSSGHPIWSDPNKYSIYLGIWNENYQNKVGDFDRELADSFLGQYAYWWGNRTSAAELANNPPIYNYGPITPPPNERQCPSFTIGLEGDQEHSAYLYQHKITTLPESKIYSGNSYPFDSVLRVNGGFFAIPPGAIDTEPYCTYCPQRSIFNIEDNAWGTPKNEVSKMFRNKYVISRSVGSPSFQEDPNTLSDLNNYIPIYKHLDPETDFDYFSTAIGISNWQDSIIKPEMMKSGYFPGLAIIPHMDKMKVDIVVDNAGNTEEFPVLEVDYRHWRCTEGQVNGDTPCPPDDDNPLDPFYCPDHWCLMGNVDGDGNSLGPFPVGQWREDKEVFNAMVFQNYNRRREESQNIRPNDCILYCEEDIKREVCACPEQDEPIHGFENYNSRVLYVRHIDMSVPIVYPIEHDYTGFWVSEQLEKGNSMRKQVVMGEPPTPDKLREANVMSTRILDLDVTNDLDALEPDTVGKFQEQIVVSNTHLNPPQNEVVSLPQYYSFVLGTMQSADDPSESISVKVDGTEFDDLTDYLTPAYGLSSFNIVLDGEGLSTDLSFRSRPAKLPKRDVLMQKIGPRAIEGRIPKPAVNVVEGRPLDMEQKGDSLA